MGTPWEDYQSVFEEKRYRASCRLAFRRRERLPLETSPFQTLALLHSLLFSPAIFLPKVHAEVERVEKPRDFLIKFKWLWGEVKSIELFFSSQHETSLFFPSSFSRRKQVKGVYMYVAEVAIISAFVSVEKFLVSRIKETMGEKKVLDLPLRERIFARTIVSYLVFVTTVFHLLLKSNIFFNQMILYTWRIIFDCVLLGLNFCHNSPPSSLKIEYFFFNDWRIIFDSSIVIHNLLLRNFKFSDRWSYLKI